MLPAAKGPAEKESVEERTIEKSVINIKLILIFYVFVGGLPNSLSLSLWVPFSVRQRRILSLMTVFCIPCFSCIIFEYQSLRGLGSQLLSHIDF